MLWIACLALLSGTDGRPVVEASSTARIRVVEGPRSGLSISPTWPSRHQPSSVPWSVEAVGAADTDESDESWTLPFDPAGLASDDWCDWGRPRSTPDRAAASSPDEAHPLRPPLRC